MIYYRSFIYLVILIIDLMAELSIDKNNYNINEGEQPNVYTDHL